MTNDFGYTAGEAVKALELADYYVWDCSVIKAEGKYHMFSSRWPKELGFGYNWLYNSQVIHSVSDTPEGPYTFQNVVFPRRSPSYFDGKNTHNTCIKAWNGKYYLYYMGCTYHGEVPTSGYSGLEAEFAVETWNRKRIGLGVADSINGPFVRKEVPLLEPRDCSYWDCTITTNPSVAILPSGKTYMIYKSRSAVGRALQLGVAVAESPEGPFRRLWDEPILKFDNPDFHVEDPFLWYDEKRKKFCMIAKDDCKNGAHGITGEWGSGFYAESNDCIHFEIAKNPKVYSRTVSWADGHSSRQCNLERPALLFDEIGVPTHLFCATGDGDTPYQFTGDTYVICLKLNRRD